MLSLADSGAADGSVNSAASDLGRMVERGVMKGHKRQNGACSPEAVTHHS